MHPCQDLARRVVDLYLVDERIHHLVLMPCCLGKLTEVPQYLIREVGRYKAWCIHLAQRAQGNLTFDHHAITPANGIITASKEPGEDLPA